MDAKQGADYGYTKVRGLHPLLATVSTPIAAPVIVGSRLRRGSAGSAKGAASFVAEAITTARAAGATGVLLARMDSAFDSHSVVSICIRAGVHFSITTKQTRPVRAAIDTIAEHAWVPIAYPHAIYDEAIGAWISDAEIAETTYTAFRSRRKSERITVRLIVRRVRDKNVAPGQGELFTAWRYHAFITDSTLQLVAAEKQHRHHHPVCRADRGVNTRSSNRSTPTSKTQPWPICPRLSGVPARPSTMSMTRPGSRYGCVVDAITFRRPSRRRRGRDAGAVGGQPGQWRGVVDGARRGFRAGRAGGAVPRLPVVDRTLAEHGQGLCP